MKILFYENSQKTLRVFLDGSDDPLYSGRGVDSAFIDVGEEENDMPYSIPLDYVKNVPGEDSDDRKFLEELRRFNPTLLRDVEKISGSEEELVIALRGAKKSLEKEIALEEKLEGLK